LDSQTQIMEHQRLHEQGIDAQHTRFFYGHDMAATCAEDDGDIRLDMTYSQGEGFTGGAVEFATPTPRVSRINVFVAARAEAGSIS